MNIRTKVKLSFSIIIAMLLFLGFISAIITYQIKENSNFRESIAAILLMQEGMNDIIRESTQSTEITKLEQLHTKFVAFEKNFEVMRETLSSHKNSLLASVVMLNIREDKTIQNYLNELYTNEHRIELMYDEIFKLAREKLDYITQTASCK